MQIGLLHSSTTCVRCLTHFVPWLYGEKDIREKRLRSKIAIEGDDTRQERPEDHQDVDIPGGTLLLQH